jgi:multidrug resistance efflux pump
MAIGGAISAKESAAMVAPLLRQRGQGGNGGGGGGGGNRMVLVFLPQPGSYVKKGDIVAEFDRERQLQDIDDERAEVVQAEADLQKVRAAQLIALDTEQQAVRTAKANWEKAQLDLKTAEVRSEIEAEKLKIALEEAEVEYKQLQEQLRLTEISQKAELRAAEIKRDETKVGLTRSERNAQGMVMRAPIDGLVVMMPILKRESGDVSQVRTGDEVAPGTFFMQIVDTSGMIMTGTINQVDSQYFRVGQRADIRLDAYPDAAFPGRVASIGALAISGSSGGFSRGGRTDYVKRIPVTFAIEARDARIIPDLSASAHVVLAAEKDVVIAPREGVWEEAAKFFAYVQEGAGSVFTKREVQPGPRTATQVAIVAGLQPGDRVALSRPPRN